MSKYIDDIVFSLKNYPGTWSDNEGWGCKKGNIEIFGYSKVRLLTIITVKINGHIMPTNFRDKWKLEGAIGWWYKNVPLSQLTA